MQHQHLDQFPGVNQAAKVHSDQLRARILERIRQQGPLSFADYMEMALYSPGLGYYSGGSQKFGASGDFVTAPEISPLFANCLARQAEQVLRDIPGGEILEFGAGSGVMAADVLKALAAVDCLPERYFIMERSADLRARQKEHLAESVPQFFSRIVWLDALPNAFKGVVFANEVLDAMPVHVFKVSDGVKEFYVDEKQGEFIWKVDQPSTTDLIGAVENLNVEFEKDYQSEINLWIQPWLKSISDFLQEGVVLISDYGYLRDAYYHADRHMGTLMCHYRHFAHTNPLILPGIQDITAHVDFSAVMEDAVKNNFDVLGFCTQAQFLLSAGVLDYVKTMNDNSARFNLSQQLKRLVLPSEMGEIFKVVALSKHYNKSLLGFQWPNNSQR